MRYSENCTSEIKKGALADFKRKKDVVKIVDFPELGRVKLQYLFKKNIKIFVSVKPHYNYWRLFPSKFKGALELRRKFFLNDQCLKIV